MTKQLLTGLLVLSGTIFISSVSANEIKMKDINTLSKKNKVILINKNELGKYLHLTKIKSKPIHELVIKKVNKKPKLFNINKIKDKNLIGSLLVYKKFMIENGKSKNAENMILKKAKKIKNLDYDFFKEDFLHCNVNKLSNIIKELSNEFK